MKKWISYGLLISVIFFGLFLAGCMKNEKTLTPDNSAPMINYFDLYPQTVIRSNTVAIVVNYKDPDNDPVTFTITADSNNPAVGVLTADPNDKTKFYWYAPQIAGRYWFKAIGNDGHFQTESIFSIIVLSRPPDVEIIADTSGGSYKIPSTHQTQAAISKSNYTMSVVDLDEPPTTTVSAKVSLSTSDTSANASIIAGYSHLSFIDFNDTDVISIPNGDSDIATITLNTFSRTINLQTIFYCNTYPDILRNSVTYTIEWDFIDESGYKNSVTRTLRVNP